MDKSKTKQAKRQRHVRVEPVQTADSTSVKLRYPISFIASGAVTRKAFRWTPNAPYDVDPVLGSTATPGYSEYAAMYTYSRVERYRVKMTFTNLDNIPIALYTYHSNVDPGTAGTSAVDYAQSFKGRTELLAPFYASSGSFTLNDTVDTSRILGMSMSQADSFRSAVASVPADLLWWGFTVATMTGVNFTSGVAYEGYIEMTIRFYGRQTLLTTFKSSAALEAERLVFKSQRSAQVESQLALLEQRRKIDKEEEDREVGRLVTLLSRSSDLTLQQRPGGALLNVPETRQGVSHCHHCAQAKGGCCN